MKYILTLIFVLITLTINTLRTQATGAVVKEVSSVSTSKLHRLTIFDYRFLAPGSKSNPEVNLRSRQTHAKIIRTSFKKKESCRLYLNDTSKKGSKLAPLDAIHMFTCVAENCESKIHIYFEEGKIKGLNNLNDFNNRKMILDFKCWTGPWKDQKFTIKEKFRFRATVEKSMSLYTRKNLTYFEEVRLEEAYRWETNFIPFGIPKEKKLSEKQFFGQQFAFHPAAKIRGLFPFYYNRTLDEYFIDYDNINYNPVFEDFTIPSDPSFQFTKRPLAQSLEWVIKNQTVEMNLTLANSKKARSDEKCEVSLIPEHDEFCGLNLPSNIQLITVNKFSSGKRVYLHFEPKMLKNLSNLQQLNKKTMSLYIVCTGYPYGGYAKKNLIVRTVKLVVPNSIPLAISRKTECVREKTINVVPKIKFEFLAFEIPKNGLKEDFCHAVRTQKINPHTYTIKAITLIQRSKLPALLSRWESIRRAQKANMVDTDSKHDEGKTYIEDSASLFYKLGSNGGVKEETIS